MDETVVDLLIVGIMIIGIFTLFDKEPFYNPHKVDDVLSIYDKKKYGGLNDVILPFVPYACNSDKVLDNIVANLQEHTSKTKTKLFVEALYHEDYYDIIPLINDLTDNNKTFNNHTLHTRVVEPNEDLTAETVQNFIDQLNEANSKTNKNEIKRWGYAEQFDKRNFKWEQQLTHLGLIKSLYKDPVGRASVDLIDVFNCEQYETDDQTRYSANVIIKKQNSRTELLLKINFVQQKDDEKINIEDVSVVGYFYDKLNVADNFSRKSINLK